MKLSMLNVARSVSPKALPAICAAFAGIASFAPAPAHAIGDVEPDLSAYYPNGVPANPWGTFDPASGVTGPYSDSNYTPANVRTFPEGRMHYIDRLYTELERMPLTEELESKIDQSSGLSPKLVFPRDYVGKYVGVCKVAERGYGEMSKSFYLGDVSVNSVTTADGRNDLVVKLDRTLQDRVNAFYASNNLNSAPHVSDYVDLSGEGMRIHDNYARAKDGAGNWVAKDGVFTQFDGGLNGDLRPLPVNSYLEDADAGQVDVKDKFARQANTRSRGTINDYFMTWTQITARKSVGDANFRGRVLLSLERHFTGGLTSESNTVFECLFERLK